jgi:predicted RNA-binding Zn-ribbon protein involved in translation (DUF1610 family)
MGIRFYVSNDSYPELREVPSRWKRNMIWWNAFLSASRDARFLLFVLIQLILVAGWIVLAIYLPGLESATFEVKLGARGLIALLSIITWGVLALSWGGDLVRPHLRRVSPIARHACPRCGHQLITQLAAHTDVIRCPECGSLIPRAALSPPYPLPRQFRAVRL